MGFRFLAYTVALVHFTYLAYVFLGGYWAWRRPRTLWLHLVASGWALGATVTPVGCPLTAVENWLRAAADAPQLDSDGFIVHYLEGLLYPARYATAFQLAVIPVVVVSWIGFYRRWHGAAAVENKEPVEQ